MKHRILVLTLAFSLTALANAAVGPTHVVGNISNITSINGGLLVRVGATEVPQNCTSGRVWMFIPQEQTSITSLTLMSWTMGKQVVVYTAPTSSGYCLVTQVDPQG
jgi:hypothetical protein